jgi:hypothetical protein
MVTHLFIQRNITCDSDPQGDEDGHYVIHVHQELFQACSVLTGYPKIGLEGLVQATEDSVAPHLLQTAEQHH